MKTVLSFLPSLLVLIQVAVAQPITIGPKFRAGQVLRLELKKTREDNRAGRPTGTSTTPITLRVLKADVNGFVVDWIPAETRFEDPAQASHPIFQFASKILKDLHLEAVLNSSGAFQRLRNQTAVETKMQLAVDSMMAKLAESIPEPRRQQTLEAMSRMVTPKVLIAAATREVQLYFALYGIEIEKGKPFDGNVDVPNPLGEGSLSSQIRINVKEIDPSAEEVQLTLEQRYDPDALLSLLPAALGTVGPRLASAARSRSGNVLDRGEFTFNTRSGCMQRIQHERTATMGQVRRLDRTEISLLKSE